MRGRQRLAGEFHSMPGLFLRRPVLGQEEKQLVLPNLRLHKLAARK